MTHPHAEYWDKGAANVPDMTGARHLLDGQDIVATCAALGIALPLGDVLDVGCGTGRLAPFCQGYLGLDIAQSAVDYCRARGRQASVISGPHEVMLAGRRATVCALSLLTHMDRPERQDYLRAFRGVARQLLVDIIPGDGSGNVARWTAVPEEFERDLLEAGFTVLAQVERPWDTGDSLHRFYHAEAI